MDNYDDCIEADGLHRFSAEASMLGLSPGRGLPRQIATKHGNGHPFIYYGTRHCPGGDIGAWEYRQEFGGLTLTIFND